MRTLHLKLQTSNLKPQTSFRYIMLILHDTETIDILILSHFSGIPVRVYEYLLTYPWMYLKPFLTAEASGNIQIVLLTDDVVETLLKAAMYAPSAVNKQPWHFIVFRDRKIMEKIIQFHEYASMLRQADVAILVCWDEELQHDTGYGPVDCSACHAKYLAGCPWTGIRFSLGWSVSANPREWNQFMDCSGCRRISGLSPSFPLVIRQKKRRCPIGLTGTEFILKNGNNRDPAHKAIFTMNYQDTLDYLVEQLPMFQKLGPSAYRTGLDNTLKLDEYFQKSSPAFPVHSCGRYKWQRIGFTYAGFRIAGCRV